MADLHPVKEETFAISEMTNIDPKGFTREVDTYRVMPTPRGDVLYMARTTPGHPRFHYLESWLVPHLAIRVNKFHFFEGISPTQDLYIDIALIDNSDADVWHTKDIYIDVVTHHGSRIQMLDLDELGEAISAGVVALDDVHAGLTSAQRVMDGIYLHGSARMWLEQEGVQLHSEVK